MTNQIKIPKGEEIALGALTALGLSLTLTTQALADGGMMGVVNLSNQNVKITCANKSKATLEPGESANCTDKKGLKQSMTVKAIGTNTYYPGKKIGKSNHIVVDKNGDSYQE